MWHPPTDNLYKFIAISGIILLFFSIYFPIKSLWVIQNKIDSSAVELEQISLEYKFLQEDMIYFENKLKNVEIDIDHMTEEQFFKKYNKELSAKLHDDNSELVKLYRENEIKSAIHGKKLEQTKFIFLQAKILIFFSLLGSCVALIMINYGFKNWYEKHQRYQDALISKQ